MKYNIFLLLICLIFLSSAVLKAHAATLKEQSIVTGDMITLGDLFSGLDYNTERVLGAAPRPGTEMVLNAQTLMRVAIAMDLDWRPGSASDYITIKRAATLVPQETIETSLRTALEDKGLTGSYNLEFTSGKMEIILPPDMPAQAEIANVSYNADNSWFEADVMAPSAANVHQQIRVSGKIERLVDVPVLLDTLSVGSVIRERDIQIVAVPAHSINHDVILSAQDLVGQTPRRMVIAGKPIKVRDVESPRIVNRGDQVTMIYKSGGMQLTARGKAMDFGSKGDNVRVVNEQSNRSIDAIVSGEQEVTVNF
jgi:flagella basal body P-ring formation protein FlgA